MALENTTLKEIHEVILKSASLNEAAINLNVNSRTLSRHLSLHRDKPLSYEDLKRLTIDQAAQQFGEKYEKKLVAPKISLNERTLCTIHERILQSKNVNQAASKLGVGAATLNSHLGKFLYEEESLSYEILRNLSVAQAIEQFGDDYKKELKAPKVSLDKITLHEIHSAILKHKTLYEAANSLGSFHSTLASHLAKFSHLGSRLNFELLRGLNVEQAKEQFGDDYEKEMKAPKVSLSEMTLRGIHLAIRNSTSLNAAATSLGVSQVTLKTHLNKFIYQTDTLSYELLKKLTVEAAKEKFGEDYEKEMNDPETFNLKFMNCSNLPMDVFNSEKDTPALYALPPMLETPVPGNLALDQNLDGNNASDGSPKRQRLSFFSQSLEESPSVNFSNSTDESESSNNGELVRQGSLPDFSNNLNDFFNFPHASGLRNDDFFEDTLTCNDFLSAVDERLNSEAHAPDNTEGTGPSCEDFTFP